ncbi:MAG: hypothetical protein KKG93_12885 [Bacteroidetes bacterium]|nr:hypothetical protein [Bacteroidota bacterium]
MKKNKPNKYDFISRIILPVVALVFSLLAYKISLNTYDSSLEPQLYCNIISPNSKEFNHPPSLFLLNEGITPVSDIRIRYHRINYDILNNEFGGILFSTKDWKYFNALEPLDSLIIPIDSSYINSSLTEATVDENYMKPKISSYIPFLIYTIKYRRIPDKKLYIINRYGIVLRNRASSFPIVDAYGGFFFDKYEFLKPKLDSISAKL